MSRMSLDQIAAAAEQRKLEQRRESIAQMADEVERRRTAEQEAALDELAREAQAMGLYDAPTPEATVPDDWLLQEAFAKAKAKEGLSEDMKTLADVVKHFTLETDT